MREEGGRLAGRDEFESSPRLWVEMHRAGLEGGFIDLAVREIVQAGFIVRVLRPEQIADSASERADRVTLVVTESGVVIQIDAG